MPEVLPSSAFIGISPMKAFPDVFLIFLGKPLPFFNAPVVAEETESADGANAIFQVIRGSDEKIRVRGS